VTKRGGNPEADVALRRAAWSNDLAAAKKALADGADPDSTVGGPGYEGETNALNNAARNKALEIVRLLIEDGVKLNVVNKGFNHSPLDQCAWHGNRAEAKLLLKAGANPKAGSGLYTLENAKEHGNEAEYNYALQHLVDRSKPSKITVAAEIDPDKAEPNKVTKRGGNPEADVALRRAAWSNDLAAAKKALADGADPDSTVGGPGYEGETNALNNAARNKALEIVRLLIEDGVKLNVVNKGFNHSPLDQCAWHGNRAEAKLLLEAGANPNAGSGLYTLEKAKEHGNEAEYKYALQHLVDSSKPSKMKSPSLPVCMEVTVKQITGQGLTVQVNPSDSIEVVIVRILQQHPSMIVKSFQLSFDGQKLSNEQTLDECGIKARDELFLVPCAL